MIKIFANERKDAIMDILQVQNRVTVTQLAEKFNVSEATIRRDLQELEIHGQLKRAHGGAILNIPNNVEPSFKEKEILLLEEKMHIAAIASTFVRDGDVIILDSGTTIIQMIPHIANKKITIITNSIATAYALTPFENIKLIVAGGENRSITKAIVGSFANEVFKALHANKAFIGTNAFDFDFGISTPNVEEAHTKRAMIACADEIFVLADHTKFNKSSMVKFADTNQIDYFITDNKISKNALEKLKQEEVKVLM